MDLSIRELLFAYYRKVAIYMALLAVLLVCLYLVGRPAKITVAPGGEAHLDTGGTLAQLRHEVGLTESQIGKIDPAGSTAKLATFGLRGVAIALLWHRSQEYQKRFDWNNVIAISKQLVFLEPHFTSIWEFLGWNLAYNASAEFDDYRERYRWVIRGIDFLIEGVELNQLAPKLCKATGWTISQKIGIADEKEQYRRLLREDDDFWQRHDKLKLPSERDNWLLGIRWYKQGEHLVREKKISIGNESEFLYFSNSRLNLFNYAKWKRTEGKFGEEPIRAWQDAGRAWKEFGQDELSTAIPKDGSMRMKRGVEPHLARLETTDIVREENKQLVKELEAIEPGMRERIAIQRWKELAETPGQQGTLLTTLQNVYEPKSQHDDRDYTDFITVRKYLDENEPDWQKKLQSDLDTLYQPDVRELKKIPSMLLNDEERDIVSKADSAVDQIRGRSISLLDVGPKTLAQELQASDVSREAKRRARDIAAELDRTKQKTRYSDLYRGILNYEYRFREVAVESTQEADDAQRKRYNARKAYYAGDPQEAVRGWIDAMGSWQALFDKPGFEDIPRSSQFIREIIDIVEKFVILLDNNNTIFKGDEPMQGLIRNKLDQENNPQPVLEALDFAERLFAEASSDEDEPELARLVFRDNLAEKGEARRQQILEKAEEYFLKVCFRFEGINASVEFMKLGPLLDIREKMIEANAYYIRSLTEQGKSLPEPLPLRSFVELMMKHDSQAGETIAKAIEAYQGGQELLRENKAAEAQTRFDEAIEFWKPVLEKYPIIPLDPTLQNHAELRALTARYVEALNAQEKQIPEDFPLKSFLPR